MNFMASTEESKAKAFAERLKQLRMQAGLSQKAFAESIGLNYTQYNRYEQGETIPYTESLARLADALEVSVDYLLDGDTKDAAFANFEDKELLAMFEAVEQFSPDEKKEIKSIIDAYITRRKVRQLAT